MEPGQQRFLQEHQQGVLATGRGDGSPQASTVLYDFDGRDIVVSAKSYTAKWKNILRQPRVALAVNDGHAQLIVYGTADGVEADPERAELTKRVFSKLGAVPEDEESFHALLEEQQRTVIRIRPDKVVFNE